MEMEIESEYKCLRSDQKIGQARCQGADPLKTKVVGLSWRSQSS